MKQRSSWKMLGGAIMVTILVGCATVSVPPSRMVEQHDHAGLTSWYKKEATNLRAQAEDMRRMVVVYQEASLFPGYGDTQLKMVEHCRNLAVKYTKAAEEAEALSKLHAEQIGRQ